MSNARYSIALLNKYHPFRRAQNLIRKALIQMKVKVVGTSDIISYKDKKTGEDKRARNVFIVREPSIREKGVTGLVAGAIFLPETFFAKIPIGGFDPKKEYDFVYESDGRFSFLADIREAS